MVIATVFLAALASPSQEHAIGNATCALEFQERIKEAIAIKLECSSAALQDCCQVGQAISYNTFAYNVRSSLKKDVHYA